MYINICITHTHTQACHLRCQIVTYMNTCVCLSVCLYTYMCACDESLNQECHVSRTMVTCDNRSVTCQERWSRAITGVSRVKNNGHMP